MGKIVKLICAGLLLASQAFANTYWVSPTGTSGASGADSASNAKSLAWFNANAVAGDVCRFKSGTYTSPIDPVNSGTSSDRIRYYGFPNDPTAVTVTDIVFGGTNYATRRGDYCTARWVQTSDDLQGTVVYLQGGSAWSTAAYDSIVKVSGPSSEFNWYSRHSVFDSLTITGTITGGDTHYLNCYTGPINDPSRAELRPNNNVFKNSTVTLELNGSAATHVVAFNRALDNTMTNNTFNVTITSVTGYFFFIEHYRSYSNSFSGNVWNVTANATPLGTVGGISHRDSSSYNRYVGETFLVSGTGRNQFLWTNSGSFGETTVGNTLIGSLFKVASPGGRLGGGSIFQFQDGSRADTLMFNTFITSAAYPAMTIAGISTDNSVIRNNTFYSGNTTVFSISAEAGLETPTRLAGNIFYSTVANSEANELVRVTEGTGIDSAGCFFARGGNATYALDKASTNFTPGASGMTISRWGSPQFIDSTYATFDGHLASSSYALNSMWTAGYAGAYVGGETGSALAISTSSLPDQTVDVTFDTAVEATGGTPPYTWEVAGGNIASWIDFNLPAFESTGQIVSATGFTPVTISLVARVTDSVGDTISKAFTFDVDPATVNGISSMTVKEETGQYSIGVRAIIVGDGDSSTVARLFYRRYGVGANYDSGMVMVRRRGSTIHVGRLLHLSPATTYQYYIEATDADGGYVTTADTAATRPIPSINATGNVYYVSMAGSEAASGLTPALAVRTIGTALGKLSAAGASGTGGGVILIGPGEWHEKNTFNFADASGQNPKGYFIIGNDPALRDSIIIDGSNEKAANENKNSDGTTITWVAYNYDANPDSIYYALYKSADSCTQVTLNYGERLHKKTSLAELKANALGVIQGFFCGTNDTLFVKRANGSSPTGTILHAGYYDNLIWLQKKRIRVSNIHFRFAGGAAANGYGVRIGAGGSFLANGSSVDSCRFTGIGLESIVGTVTQDSISIRNCVFDALGVGHWTYQATKTRAEEATRAFNATGKAWTAWGNTIDGMSNGIVVYSGSATDSVSGSDCEILNNTIRNSSDDAIEADLLHGINTLIMDNVVTKANSMISLAPLWTGPTWVLRNSIKSPRGYSGVGFKLGTAGAIPGDGYALIAHNTVYQGSGLGEPVYFGGRCKQKIFRNNALKGGGTSRYVVNNANTSNPDSVGTFTNDFNYNVLDSIPNTARMARFGNVAYSLASWRSNAVGFKFDTNGNFGTIAVIDSASGNLHPTAASILIDAGQRIPGVNTGMSVTGPQYRGLAPDVGAYEYETATRRRSWMFRLIHIFI